MSNCMKITFNKTFEDLLNKYKVPADLLFDVELPKNITKRLNDKISITEKGVSLESFSHLRLASEEWDNQSYIEDDENHFHIDDYMDNKNAFMIATKTLYLLASKFKQARLNDVRFTLSFQTDEMGKNQAIKCGLHEKGDKYYLSDRLSFFKKRGATLREDIEDQFTGILIIDI